LARRSSAGASVEPHPRPAIGPHPKSASNAIVRVAGDAHADRSTIARDAAARMRQFWTAGTTGSGTVTRIRGGGGRTATREGVDSSIAIASRIRLATYFANGPKCR